MFALAAPALLGALGIAADFGTYASKHSELQSISDAAALSGAQELASAGTTAKTIEAVVSSYVHGNVKQDVQIGTTVDAGASKVTVQIVEAWTPFFAHFLGAKITPISVHATAKLEGQSSICVLALDGGSSGALSLDNKSYIKANGCGVYANSISSTAISLKNKSEITADLTCAAGGVSNKGKITPAALSDCPQIEDPLSSRGGPSFGSCNYTAYSIKSGSADLLPGVYCGGIVVGGSAVVTIQPGTYIVKDGPLSVSGKASFTGENVGFYLTGNGAVLDFKGNTTISLAGPIDGDLAGLLFYADQKATAGQLHVIRSTNAHTMTGTIYLPTGNLVVDPGAKVAQNSAYTAIIANKINVDMGPELVLNSDYSGTDVPVPDGIRAGSNVVLSD